MRKLKKIGLFFVLCLLFLLAFAVTASAEESGACGDGLTYTYSDGTLRIEGVGAMASYDNNTNKAPWSHLRREITRVEIGEGVTSVGAYAFAFCSSLETVSFPETLEMIGGDAFVNCTALLEISLPDAVRTIGMSAFQGCTSLARVASLGSITELKGSVFSGCTALATVYFPRTLASISATAFYRVPLAGLTVYYPDSPARFAGIVILADGAVAGTPINPAAYKKVYYAVRVNVQYVMVGGRAEAPIPPAAVLGYADGTQRYEIPVPEVVGHTHDVAGGVLSGSFVDHTDHTITLTVTYTPNKYNLTLYFVDHKGAPLLKDGTPLSYTEQTAYGDLFDFDIQGFLEENGLSLYTPESMSYEDMLITGDYTAILSCIPPKYTLTVHYVDTLLRTVCESYTEEVYYTDAFSVPSPTPAFYDLRDGQSEVTGVMGAEDTTVTVYYTPHTFRVTVQYVDEQGSPMMGEDGQPLAATVGEYLYKTEYSVISPSVLHYTPSIPTVTGTVDGLTEEEGAAHAIAVTVRYTLNSYDVVVHLQDQNGRTIAEDFYYSVRYGEEFSFAPPTLDGYETEVTELSGVMDQDEEMHRIVVYTKILPPEEILPEPKTHVALVVILILLAVGATAGASFWALKKLR